MSPRSCRRENEIRSFSMISNIHFRKFTSHHSKCSEQSFREVKHGVWWWPFKIKSMNLYWISPLRPPGASHSFMSTCWKLKFETNVVIFLCGPDTLSILQPSCQDSFLIFRNSLLAFYRSVRVRNIIIESDLFSHLRRWEECDGSLLKKWMTLERNLSD